MKLQKIKKFVKIGLIIIIFLTMVGALIEFGWFLCLRFHYGKPIEIKKINLSVKKNMKKSVDLS